jgi:hypothetical protein
VEVAGGEGVGGIRRVGEHEVEVVGAVGQQDCARPSDGAVREGQGRNGVEVRAAGALKPLLIVD